MSRLAYSFDFEMSTLMTWPGGTRLMMVCCSKGAIDAHPVLALLGSVLDWMGRSGLIARYSHSLERGLGVFTADDFGVSSPEESEELKDPSLSPSAGRLGLGRELPMLFHETS